MICEHCGESERVENAPCPACKFQPYNEASTDERGELPQPTAEEIDTFDICPTPDALALAICQRVAETIRHRLPSSPPPRILEPSAGDGAFVRAARQVWPASQITAVELRQQCQDRIVEAGADHTITDSLEGAFTSGAAEIGNVDLVVGNPPFSFAENHIRLLLGALRPGAVLAFLLRTGFYESHTRIPFWNEFPEDSFAPVVPRPSFKLNSKGKKGTDSQSYGLFVWTKGKAIEELSLRAPHLVWRDPAPRGRKKRDRPREPHEHLGDTRGVIPTTTEPEVFDLE